MVEGRVHSHGPEKVFQKEGQEDNLYIYSSSTP